MKKILALLLSALMLLGLLGACGTPAAEESAPPSGEESAAPASEAPAPAEPVELKVWHDGDEAIMQTIADTVNPMLADSGVSLVFEKRTGLSDQLKLYGGDAANGPDMYFYAHDSLGTFAAMDILAPLTDLVDESTWAGDLQMTVEAAQIAGLLAAELGVDVTTAKRAGLLHDLGKSIDHEVEGSHVTIGVDVARKYKESPEVLHAIEAHHGDVEPHTVIACLVQAADAISASRPGARRENIENYVKRLEKLEEVSRSFPGIAGCYAIQAGREIRVMVKPEEVSEDQMVLLARDIAKKIEDELTYPGQIKVHVLRETKAIEYAK